MITNNSQRPRKIPALTVKPTDKIIIIKGKVYRIMQLVREKYYK